MPCAEDRKVEPWQALKNLVSGLFLKDSLELFRESRDDVVDIADNTVGGHFEDGRIGVFIDGENDFR